MIGVALLALALGPAQTDLDLGDPRKRGGARDLFDDDEGDDAEVPQSRSFILRPPDAVHIGPVAVTPSGRYAAYAVQRSGGFHVVIVDTASATLRAVGPILPTRPRAIALSQTRLIVVDDRVVHDYAWFAAESAQRAASAPHDQATTRSLTLPPGTARDALASDAAGWAAVLHEGEAGRWSLAFVHLESGAQKLVPLPTSRRGGCAGLHFAAQGLVAVSACRDPEGWSAVRIPVGTLAAEPAVQVTALDAPSRSAVLTTIAGLGSLTVAGWADEEAGLVTLHAADGKERKRIRLERAPRSISAAERNAVAACADGSVWMLGLGDGDTKLGVEAPDLSQRVSALAPPRISDAAHTVVMGVDGVATERPRLWVIPALR